MHPHPQPPHTITYTQHGAISWESSGVLGLIIIYPNSSDSPTHSFYVTFMSLFTSLLWASQFLLSVAFHWIIYNFSKHTINSDCIIKLSGLISSMEVTQTLTLSTTISRGHTEMTHPVGSHVLECQPLEYVVSVQHRSQLCEYMFTVLYCTVLY